MAELKTTRRDCPKRVFERVDCPFLAKGLDGPGKRIGVGIAQNPRLKGLRQIYGFGCMEA